MKLLPSLLLFAGVTTALAAPSSDRDAKAHWSFQPLTRPAVPGTAAAGLTNNGSDPPAGATAPFSNPIDGFIAAKLAENGLTFSPPADPVTWLRRVTLDLTGLPPTPEETADFLTGKSYQGVVDRLLASPRHGERQAQHWLDVVRYADTHGFEVNTERPNAWPYRDYVINAFNTDTPYDRFIRDQIAGDQMDEPAATGFLVTASLLLPDQTGADEPSKRLARQDAIDEIVVNIGQTFLGLSIGCARCHDHKFDPVTARDYYAMQAFVAGVEYGEQDLNPARARASREEAGRLRVELGDLDRKLSVLVPLAKSGHLRPMVNARENVDRFSPVKAKRLRFTIKSTNSLEPCIDELEVFETGGKNIAAAAAGARSTSGGDTEVPGRHLRRFINDGVYGNSSSWMSGTPGKGWVEVEFPTEKTIDRVSWGRDREGKFTDRLATDYQIEIQPADTAAPWQPVADAADRQ
ncbi:MAG: Planctomycete cytochrome, partial [Verrucomicrobiales bacterium]|nr:Planctomycete cytochrome [Verrucomicrobiales bacterium]